MLICFDAVAVYCCLLFLHISLRTRFQKTPASFSELSRLNCIKFGPDNHRYFTSLFWILDKTAAFWNDSATMVMGQNFHQYLGLSEQWNNWTNLSSSA